MKRYNIFIMKVKNDSLTPTSPMEKIRNYLGNVKWILMEYKPTHFILFGDFSFLNIIWKTDTEESIPLDCLETIKRCIFIPTIRGTPKKSRLDLLSSSKKKK